MNHLVPMGLDFHVRNFDSQDFGLLTSFLYITLFEKGPNIIVELRLHTVIS